MPAVGERVGLWCCKLEASGLVDRATTRKPTGTTRVKKPPKDAAPRASQALMKTGRELIEGWMASKGWQPWDFQREAWDAYLRGEDGLVQVPTGAGKTYAAVLGPLMHLADELAKRGHVADAARDAKQRARATKAALEAMPGPFLMYITPLRAVTRDIEKAIVAPIEAVGLPALVESRTGDTKASVRAKQRERMPHVLLTTPESLCLLLTRPDAKELLGTVRCVVVDEWHELLASKRGSATELALARLRSFSPSMRTWGLSATLPNAREALEVLRGVREPGTGPARVVTAKIERDVRSALGGALGAEHAAGGAGRTGPSRANAGVYQHAFAGGAVVSCDCVCETRVEGDARAAPWEH
jgi:ATP-dependent helicase Lhr and Lhr-like helicase